MWPPAQLGAPLAIAASAGFTRIWLGQGKAAFADPPGEDVLFDKMNVSVVKMFFSKFKGHF